MTKNLETVVKVGAMAIAACLSSTQALAHARWFIDDTKIANVSFSFDGVYAAILVGAALFVIAAMAVELAAARSARLSKLLFERLPVPYDLDWRILSSSLGYVLITTSFTQMIMAPNLKADESLLNITLLAAQAVVGALYLLQTRLRFAAAMTVLFPLISLVSFNPLKVIDYAFEFIGVGLAFWTVAPQLMTEARAPAQGVRRHSRIREKRQPFWPLTRERVWSFIGGEIERASRRNGSAGIEAASILRTLLGIQLIILAAHDKIFEPGVTLAFVEKYPFVNFPALLGVPGFTNLHFVFGAGLAEIVFGLLLITNTGARVIAALLTGLFTLTGLIFGLHEMLGHMPILFSLLVLVTQGGAQDSALATSTSRASPALGTALATILLGIIGIAFEPKQVEARVSIPASLAQTATGLSVPAALYERFVSLAGPAALDTDAIRDVNRTVKFMIETSKGDTRSDKDELASKIADLVIRYEMVHDTDAASLWLRYAVLTAACSPNEIAVFQSRAKSADWQAALARIPADLRAVLMPIAETAALKILKTDRLEGGIPWATLSDQAPTQGPDYIYTHTLACIVRIVSAAAEMPAAHRMQTTSLP